MLDSLLRMQLQIKKSEIREGEGIPVASKGREREPRPSASQGSQRGCVRRRLDTTLDDLKPVLP